MEAAQLPHLSADVAPIPGRIRVELDDFRVEEIPAYLPIGEGEHTFVRIEKRDLTTPRAMDMLARALDVSARDCGWAGLKDRRGVTTQWLSFPRVDPERFHALDVPGVRVLEVARHAHKLRSGHLRGNRFALRVRDVPRDRHADVRAVVARLVAEGMPNYFGEQRFGRDGGNVDRARAWLIDGGRAPRKPFERKLLVSSLQSEAFNRWLARRVLEGTMGHVLEGDVARRTDSGGLFLVEDAADAQTRADRWELSPTGPIPGRHMRPVPSGEPGRFETVLLAELGLDDRVYERMGRLGEGARRPSRVRVEAMEIETEGHDVLLAFTLPPGSYATSLLREISKHPGDADLPEAR